jgi:hypothetical protein
MAGRSGARRVAEALAEATGRSEEEMRLAMTLAVLATVVFAGLRFVRFLGDLGTDVLGRSRT